jgi:hypothetical protein
MWNVTPRRFSGGTPPNAGGVPPDVDAFMQVARQDISRDALDAILERPGTVDLLLQNPDAFAQVVARQDILPRTLEAILEHQDAVEFN